MIVTHDEPAARSQTNYILRLSLAADGLPGRYEQMWTRTEDNVNFKLCCIPFFTYGLSLGDIVRKTTDDGDYEIVSKAGHRTIRFAIQDEKFRHEGHEPLHASIARAGCLAELHGHTLGYGAIDIVDERQSESVRAAEPPRRTGTPDVGVGRPGCSKLRIVSYPDLAREQDS
jgi:hypothetical protein